MTTWVEVEQYRELDERYRQARADFERMETAYLEALKSDKTDPNLSALHSNLQRAEQEVQGLWSQLVELRRSFADTKQSNA